MNTARPSAAVILLNLNGYDDTYACIKSLETLIYDNFHVFLVDNDSSDDSYQKLMEDNHSGRFKVGVTCIQSGGNIGCAGGNNVGIKAAFELGYDYYWMLNNDTLVEKDALSALVDVIEADSSIGIIGSKIYFAGTNILWSAGGHVNPYTSESYQYGYFEEDRGKYEEIKEVDFIVGCSMLFRRELIEDIGFLQEDYFLLYEDTDLNVRAKRAGWKIVYTPHSIIHHKESSSTQSEDTSPFYSYYLIRNGYLMAMRNNKRFKWIAFLYMLVRIVKYHIVFVYRSKTKRWIRSKLIFKGALHGLIRKSGQYT